MNGKSFKESKKQNKEARKQKRRDAAAAAKGEAEEEIENKPLTGEEYRTLSTFIYSQDESEQAKMAKIEAAAGETTTINIEKNQTENFRLFQKSCCDAYNLLRHNSNKIINLFLIMLSAGMPELQKKEEIRKLQDKLNLKSSDREAEKIFIREIKEAMTTFSRRIDNAAHNYK